MDGLPTVEQNFEFSSDDEEDKQKHINAKNQLKISTDSDG